MRWSKVELSCHYWGYSRYLSLDMVAFSSTAPPKKLKGETRSCGTESSVSHGLYSLMGLQSGSYRIPALYELIALFSERHGPHIRTLVRPNIISAWSPMSTDVALLSLTLRVAHVILLSCRTLCCHRAEAVLRWCVGSSTDPLAAGLYL